MSALGETRTLTSIRTQALNLLRMPIPPQAREGVSILKVNSNLPAQEATSLNATLTTGVTPAYLSRRVL